MSRVLIAMSGGVDSSVVAAVILREHSGIGATMKLHCLPERDIEDARQVCDTLGIEHLLFDMADDFDMQVISRFVQGYERGETPNPCIDCNRHIKFKAMLEKADVLGCTHIATGHYARIEKHDGRYLLKKGIDETKDQSYVLYSLTQSELARVLLPLGNYGKAEVREMAKSLGLDIFSKKDSQDICFVPDGDYSAFIERYTGKSYPAGDFVDTEGNRLGTHRGIIRYTVGQRKGLGLSFPEPMYVKEKDVQTNTVVLCRDGELYTDTFTVRDINWIAFDSPSGEIRAKVKPRYKSIPANAVIYPLSDGRAKVVFDTKQRAVTRGQAAVFYDGDVVLGGGTIE